MVRRRRDAPATETVPALRHVLVVGGTTTDWVGFGVDAWRHRVTGLAGTIASFDVPWLTLRPYEGAIAAAEEVALRSHLVAATDGRSEPAGVMAEVAGITVLVSPHADGRRRIAETISHLSGTTPSDPIDEQAMITSLLAPSGAEPDLVVILGRPDRLPPSLVWELAYAEIVYLDLAWSDLEASHLQPAVEDFRRRHRRFGGIDE